MNNNTKPSRGLSLPPLGYRIIKTSVAVSLCLLVEYLLGYRGATMPTESAITAIICMQPYVRDSRDYAISRMAGTLIGGTWGLVFLVILALLPGLNWNLPLAYAIMGLGVMASLYTSVLLKAPDASGLAAIVFLCVVVSFPEIDQPLVQSAQRIGGVLLGTVIAILVNVLHLPRQKRKGQLFFVRTADLARDRLAHLHPAVLFKLNQLCASGAKICLMSEHAPAFFTMQMTGAKLTVPMIVMLLSQAVIMALFAYFVVFRMMGRDYEAAVMTSGVCGFGLGATPNAIANMTAMTELFGPAPTAFFVIPLIGSLIIDPVNASVITIFINLFH